MRHWIILWAAISLAGCAHDGYRYHDDGYYVGRTPASSALIFNVNTCSAGYYGHYGHIGSACGWGFGHGWGFGPSHGWGAAYWRNPYWSQRWYLPRTMESPRAGSRARALADQSMPSDHRLQRYDDLAPQRRRDLGGGERAYYGGSMRSSAFAGNSANHTPRSSGIGSGSRPMAGMSRPAQSSAPRAVARELRESRQED